jgi:hypothetical protein
MLNQEIKVMCPNCKKNETSFEGIHYFGSGMWKNRLIELDFYCSICKMDFKAIVK